MNDNSLVGSYGGGGGAKMISAKNDSRSRVEQPFELHVWKIFTSALCENVESYRQLLLQKNGIQPLRTVSFPQRLWLRTFRIRYVYILHPNGRTSGVYGPDLLEFPSSVCAFDTYIYVYPQSTTLAMVVRRTWKKKLIFFAIVTSNKANLESGHVRRVLGEGILGVQNTPRITYLRKKKKCEEKLDELTWLNVHTVVRKLKRCYSEHKHPKE